MAPCAHAHPRHRRGVDRDHPARARVAAGQLAQSWGTGDIAPPEPRAEVCLGIEQHDVAWAHYDLRPPLHAEAGRAASFIEAPIRERHVIWHDAPDRVLAQSPWAALLVSLHGTNIHTRYVSVDHLPPEDADIVRGYLADQRELQDRLIALAGTTRPVAERQAELLFALDALSLSLCHGWPERELPPVDGLAIRYLPTGERDAVLDPWPFDAPAVRTRFGARTLTERFTDEPGAARRAGERPGRAPDDTLRRGWGGGEGGGRALERGGARRSMRNEPTERLVCLRDVRAPSGATPSPSAWRPAPTPSPTACSPSPRGFGREDVRHVAARLHRRLAVRGRRRARGGRRRRRRAGPRGAARRAQRALRPGARAVLRGRLGTRAVQSQLIIDESTAMARAQPDPASRTGRSSRPGLSVFVFWNIGTLAGALLGTGLGDPGRWASTRCSRRPSSRCSPRSSRRRPRGSPAVCGGLLAIALVPFVPSASPCWRRRSASIPGVLAMHRAARTRRVSWAAILGLGPSRTRSRRSAPCSSAAAPCRPT